MSFITTVVWAVEMKIMITIKMSMIMNKIMDVHEMFTEAHR